MTISLIFACFAVAHSLFLADYVKKSIARLFGKVRARAFYRLAYTASSLVLALFALNLILLVPDKQVFSPPPLLRALMRILQGAGLLIGAASFKDIDIPEFLGLRQAYRYLRTGETGGDIEGIKQAALVTSGFTGSSETPCTLPGSSSSRSTPI